MLHLGPLSGLQLVHRTNTRHCRSSTICLSSAISHNKFVASQYFYDICPRFFPEVRTFMCMEWKKVSSTFGSPLIELRKRRQMSKTSLLSNLSVTSSQITASNCSLDIISFIWFFITKAALAIMSFWVFHDNISLTVFQMFFYDRVIFCNQLHCRNSYLSSMKRVFQ